MCSTIVEQVSTLEDYFDLKFNLLFLFRTNYRFMLRFIIRTKF